MTPPIRRSPPIRLRHLSPLGRGERAAATAVTASLGASDKAIASSRIRIAKRQLAGVITLSPSLLGERCRRRIGGDLDRLRLRLVVLSIVISVVSVTLLRDQPWSDGRTAAALNAVHIALFLGYIAWFRDMAMARLLLFGLCLGIVELAADALCVRFTHTLDYSVAHSPMLGLSPWWMPTAWMIVAAQIGYVGARLMERFGSLLGMALTALMGAVNIPFYEEMAFHAHWWRYRNCKLLGHAPVYIIVAELLIGLTLGPLARFVLRETSWGRAALAGVIGGLGTILGGLLGYGLVERVF